MTFISKFLILIICLSIKISKENCEMEKHKFFLLPLKSEGNDRKEGLEKYDYMLILKTTPLENDKYHLILNVTFPVNLFIDLSDEILYGFDSVEKYCLLDLAKQKGRYVNILGTIYDHLTKNIILEKIWIKVENILLFGEVGTGVDSRINHYILTNFKESDNESKKYFLMKKMYGGIHQNFQIVSTQMKREKQQQKANSNYFCENSGEENDLSIGDEISILEFDDKLRDNLKYNAFAKDKQFVLTNVHNFICVKYELQNYEELC